MGLKINEEKMCSATAQAQVNAVHFQSFNPVQLKSADAVVSVG
jgi:hypothetical protein